MAERGVSLVLAAVLFTGSGGLLPFLSNVNNAASNPANAPAATASTGSTIRKLVEEVDVVFMVSDRRGRPLDDVAREEILVFADGAQVSGITAFSRSDDVPLHIILMVDESDSMREAFTAEQQAARIFLQNVVRPEMDEASVLGFATSPQAGQASGRAQLLLTTVNGFQAQGQTALYDALYHAAQQMMMSSESHPARRVIVLLSDGEDDWSRHNLQDAIAMAQRADVAIYAITAHSRRLEFSGDRVLKRLTEETGGRAFVLDRFSKADEAFTKIAAELRGQYRVSFRPAAGQRGYHALRIGLRRQGKWQVRSRAGYYSNME